MWQKRIIGVNEDPDFIFEKLIGECLDDVPAVLRAMRMVFATLLHEL
jgi:hypothetical protein